MLLLISRLFYTSPKFHYSDPRIDCQLSRKKLVCRGASNVIWMSRDTEILGRSKFSAKITSGQFGSQGSALSLVDESIRWCTYYWPRYGLSLREAFLSPFKALSAQLSSARRVDEDYSRFSGRESSLSLAGEDIEWCMYYWPQYEPGLRGSFL